MINEYKEELSDTNKNSAFEDVKRVIRQRSLIGD